jgi:hypothetical protein
MHLPYFLGLQNLSMSEQAFLVLVLILAFFIAGYVVDGLMERRGFGPYGDGAVALAGLFMGLLVRGTYFPGISPYDPVLTYAVTFVTMLALLFTLVVLRNKFA